MQSLAITERITTDRIDIPLDDYRLQRRTSEECMVADVRDVRGKYKIGQRGAVEERDVADRLDARTPVDRLQRRAVVEQTVAAVTERGAAVAVKDDPLVIFDGLFDHFMEFILEIIHAFQAIRIDL
mgnify:CR=1 FL=1